jgi:hypothetical protein
MEAEVRMKGNEARREGKWWCHVTMRLLVPLVLLLRA